MNFLVIILFSLCRFGFGEQNSHFSNEYSQYQKYLSFSQFQTSEFYPAASKCENGNRDKFFWQCAPMVSVQTSTFNGKPNLFPHWNRSNSAPSCQYRVTQLKSSHLHHPHNSHRTPRNASLDSSDVKSSSLHHQKFLHPISLKISQHSCNDSFTLAKGGSSFYILAEGYFQLVCSIIDLFDNSYEVYCPHIPQHLINDQKNLGTIDHINGCMYITMILDFEHYDAYSEYGAMIKPNYRGLNYYLLNREKFCLTSSSHDKKHHTTTSSSTTTPIDSNFNRQEERYKYVFHHSHVISMERELSRGAWRLKQLPSSVEELLTLTSDPHNYDWIWDVSSTPDPHRSNHSSSSNNKIYESPTLEYCYLPQYNHTDEEKRMNLRFIGESHMRHYYDTLVSKIDPVFINTLKPKHSITYYKNYKFDQRVFAIQLANTLDLFADQYRFSICPNEDTMMTMILQTGTWDASWPPQQFMENPQSGKLLLDKLGVLTPTKHNCWKNIKSLLLDVMIAPRCRQRDRHETIENILKCEDSESERNHYMIELFNYYLDQGISKLQKDDYNPNLLYYRTRQVFLPRLLALKYVCVNHLICSKVTDASYEGLIAADGIQRELCSILQHQAME